MSLVCSIPSLNILRCDIQTGLKGSGNIINFLSCRKAVGICLPIQKQRLTVNVQLLTVAGIGGDRQNNCIAHLIAGFICCHIAIGQAFDVDKDLLAGVGQLKGNLHCLIQVAVHFDLDPDCSFSHAAGIARGQNLGKINGTYRIAI